MADDASAKFLADVLANKEALLAKAAAAGVDATKVATDKVTAALAQVSAENPVAPYFDAQHADLVQGLVQEEVAKVASAEEYLWQHILDAAKAFVEKVKSVLK